MLTIFYFTKIIMSTSYIKEERLCLSFIMEFMILCSSKLQVIWKEFYMTTLFTLPMEM